MINYCVWKQAYENELKLYGKDDPELHNYFKNGCDACDGLDSGCGSYSSMKLEIDA